jgi:hypothetical protein
VLVRLDASALSWLEIGTLPDLADADTEVALAPRLAHLAEASELGAVEWKRL